MAMKLRNPCTPIITIISASLFLIIACQNQPPDLTDLQKEQISDTLRTLTLEFLHSWEPPFDPERALKLFTRKEDFCLVIDGFPVTSYEEWEKGVPIFMADDDYFFTSYSHEVKEIRPVVLGETSGVVTIIYIWDSVSRDGTHRKTDGNATLACRQEEEGWRIVQYHGSHGEERVIE